MSVTNVNLKLNNQLTPINPKECPPSPSRSSLEIFKEKGYTPPVALTSIKGKVETLATTEQRLKEAKQSKVIDRILSLFKLTAAVAMVGLTVFGTIVATAANPVAGVVVFFSTFLIFTAFCKFCESVTQDMHKKDTGREMQSSGMLYPLFPIADVVMAFTRPSRIEKLADQQRKSVEVDFEEAEMYINDTYKDLSQMLNKEIKEKESSLRGFRHLKHKPEGVEQEYLKEIASLKEARKDLKTLRDYFSELKKAAAAA
jgi:hypothetical protein